MRPTSFPPPPPPPTSPTYLFLCRDCAKNFGWSGGEGQRAISALGFGVAGDDGMDKVTHAAIARAYEVDRGDGGGKNGAREGGKGGSEGFGGGRWLSGLSAAAPEVPPDVKSGSADSKGESAKRNTGEEERGTRKRRRRTRARTRARARRRAMRTGTRRRMGCAAWTRRTRRPEAPIRRQRNHFRPLSQESNSSR